MYNVLLVVPYPELEEVVKNVYKKRFKNSGFQLEIKVLRAEKLRENIDFKKYDVLIGRGHSAKLMKSIMPANYVVEIPITGYDLMRAILQVKETYKPKKIGIFISDKATHDQKVLENIFSENIKLYTTPSVECIEETIKQGVQMGIDTVIGGYSAVSAAKKMGINYLTIQTGEEAIYSVLSETKGIIKTIEAEQEISQTYQTILKESGEGILYIDEKGIVKIANKKAIQLLDTEAENVHNGYAEEVFPYLKSSLQSVNKTDKFIYNELITIGSKIISFDFAPVQANEKMTGVVVTCQSASKIQQLETEIRKKLNEKGLVAKYNFNNIIYKSSIMKKTIIMAKKYGAIESNILIVGETGTGKELMAQSMHNISKRQKGPFVAVNCAALPENLLESELFGYVEGAFTGSKRGGKAGLFEQANNGTIFLDEISELPINFQGKLLRVLQEKQVRRVGDDKVININVRVIAATNRNLYAEVQKGRFRQDLLYRIDILRLYIPPLKDRSEDIYPIFIYFIKEYNRQFGHDIEGCTTKAKQLLDNYKFNGNIRELRNVAERLSVICEENKITEELMKEALYPHDVEDNLLILKENQKETSSSIKNVFDKEKIITALHQSGGKKAEAAEILGIDRSTLWRKMKAYGLQ